MALIDPYGREIRTPELRREIMDPDETELLGTRRSYDTRGLTPERLAWILRQAEDDDPIRFLELAEDMEERDPHYLAVLSTRRRQVSQLKVSVQPADETPEAEADAELVKDWLARDEVEDELFDLMDAVGKGYAVCEILWDFSETQWMPKRLSYRLPAWFRFDSRTGMQLERRGGNGEDFWMPLEPAKFVLHKARAKSGLPIRGGIARCAAWWWLFKNFGTRDWLRFIEVYGHPLRVGKYHKGATDPEKAVLRRAVRNIASDSAAIVPEGMLIEFVENSGTGVRSEMYHGLLKYVDDSMSKAILGQTLTTETSASGGGAMALGQVHDEVREDIEKADAKQLGATLTRDLAVPLVLLNNGQRDAYPRVVIGREAKGDPGQLAEALAKLLPYGLRVRAQEIRERLDLGEPGDDDEVLEGSGAPLPGGPPDGAAAALRAVLLQRRGDRDEIDAAVNGLIDGDGWEPLMEPVLEPVLASAAEALARGDTLEQWRGALPELLERMDDSLIVETLRRMGFSAATSGQIGLGE